MLRKLALAALLSATPCFANTVAVFACPSKPPAGTDCLKRTLDDGSTLNINRDDYYDILINSVCIDQKDNW
jgi:hypothetical protein